VNPDKPDKIIDEYRKGRLPFSDLYRDASEGDECPDSLSARIVALAVEQQPKRPAGRLIRALQGRTRMWIEAALLTAAAIALIVALYAPRNPPDLECSGVGTGATPGHDRTGSMPEIPPRPVPQ